MQEILKIIQKFCKIHYFQQKMRLKMNRIAYVPAFSGDKIRETVWKIPAASCGGEHLGKL